MTRIEEGRLAFEFGERWNVFKLDKHRYYQKRMEKLDETKAVDFLAILDEAELYLIEIKDFRGHRIENKNRLTEGRLAIECAQKVRDSLACIIGASRNSSDYKHWRPYQKLLCDRNRKIKIILWLEYDLPINYRQRQKINASISSKVIKQKLIWLTNYILVCNTDSQQIPDLEVRNLAYKIK